jgi:tripartite-type tricarboxylate transporter receptor subunit TctC
MSTRNRVAGSYVVLLLVVPSLVAAQGTSASAALAYPSKPLRILVGFPAGSTPDVVTRTLSDKMTEDLKRPLVIENRPGAGGTIATEAAARAQPDGYTLLVSGCSGDGIVYAFIMTDRPPLDPFRDFTPVGRLMRDHWIVAVSPALGVSSVKELVALAKAKPGTLNYPSGGSGSSQHLQSERFIRRVGIDATHVSYKESPIPDLLAGRMSFAVQSLPAVAPLVKSGKLKGIATMSARRLEALPDVPTTAEAGFADLVYNAGLCLYAPGATPLAIVTRVNTALNKAQEAEPVRQRFAELGVEPVQMSVEETAKFVKELMALVDQLRITVFGKAR